MMDELLGKSRRRFHQQIDLGTHAVHILILPGDYKRVALEERLEAYSWYPNIYILSRTYFPGMCRSELDPDSIIDLINLRGGIGLIPNHVAQYQSRVAGDGR